MKPSIIAAFVASFVAVAIALRKREALRSLLSADLNRLYTIDEFIGTEEL